MKFAIHISFLILFCACQSKKETTKIPKNTDSIATATNQSNTEQRLTFGFSNETGNNILAFEEGVNTEDLTQTIDNQGQIASIKFESTQQGNDNGINLVPSNFKNCAGQVFVLASNKKVQTELSTVIFNDAFLKNHTPILVKTLTQPNKIDGVNKNKIETERQRKIKEAWKIASFGSENAYIVVFETKKDSVLASLIIGGTSYIYRDYPAKYDEGSTWRVDDGGEFPNDAIRIIAAFRNIKNEIEIITEWAGAEGANIEYVKANKNKFETIKEASRYWGAL